MASAEDIKKIILGESKEERDKKEEFTKKYIKKLESKGGK